METSLRKIVVLGDVCHSLFCVSLTMPPSSTGKLLTEEDWASQHTPTSSHFVISSKCLSLFQLFFQVTQTPLSLNFLFNPGLAKKELKILYLLYYDHKELYESLARERISGMPCGEKPHNPRVLSYRI